MVHAPLVSSLFPYTTLFRSVVIRPGAPSGPCRGPAAATLARTVVGYFAFGRGDRKSTRLNSSHTVISYAVFCLKKKRINNILRLLSIRLQRLVGYMTLITTP